MQEDGRRVNGGRGGLEVVVVQVEDLMCGKVEQTDALYGTSLTT